MSQFTDIITEKCPICGEGHVFTKKGNPLLFKMPKMNKECLVCHHKFEKEPGFFYGAMYVSYGLTILEMAPIFLISRIFVDSYNATIAIIGLSAFLLSTFNFRLSRMIWMYMFDGGKRQVQN
ncbi:DUF983 domain-containing protein [Flavobacterium arcticum]|uniref:DUF983 domain-containing protein n=1 Tax=Flavobacterium arcticum TaxID=1784713 RepID=A0A345HD67_9FLAO|nr:DUF983 domain-containing protein [Flavobacterium arcticum]AXG74527.1 DUF983 domain-containing protein [Flavobacterium arcticum]KAF2512352.1 DUF983 domain-containing protein [Flavobacterium arcticum]